MQSRRGFTLLELSIVLVIIGLIVGGVLVGKDLIEAAKIQKVIRESQGYQNAVATFRLKYNGLPGDLGNPENFFPSQSWNSSHDTIGNGIITSGAEGPDAWRQLSLAGLIGAGNMEGNEHCGASSTTEAPCMSIPGVTSPRSAYNDRASWFIGYSTRAKRNVVLLGYKGNNGGPSGGAIWPTHEGALPVLAASSIDKKVDDGMPNSGAIRAESDYGACMTDPTPSTGTYNLGDPTGYGFTGSGCSLSFPLNM